MHMILQKSTLKDQIHEAGHGAAARCLLWTPSGPIAEFQIPSQRLNADVRRSRTPVRRLPNTMAEHVPGHRECPRLRLRDQSNGSTFTIDAVWLPPTHSARFAPFSSTKTRRMLVVCGSRYSVT